MRGPTQKRVLSKVRMADAGVHESSVGGRWTKWAINCNLAGDVQGEGGIVLTRAKVYRG